MPPKKQKTPSPKDAYFERIDKVQKELGMLGAVLVVGANAGSDDEGSLSGGDDEGDDREYTAEEMARVRQILINKSRAAEIKKAQDFVSCGQGEGMCMFNTSDGNMICEGIPRERRRRWRRRRCRRASTRSSR